MLDKMLFKKPQNELEGTVKVSKKTAAYIPDEMCISCPSCKKVLFTGDLTDNFYVCSSCGYHLRQKARLRLHMIADEGSFTEYDRGMKSVNILDFPDYDRKLKNAYLESSESDAVICGECRIGGYPCAIFVMEPSFMMGSMGCVVGEKITRLFELATIKNLPVVGFTVSGGARMQEGIMSLMQMAKVSGAVGKHSNAGNFYIAVLTDPTTGGVTASFAMQADIIIAEPGALIAFAGARVIEQTIRQKLPASFQRAEFLFEHGFIDNIVERRSERSFLRKMLMFHSKQPHKNKNINEHDSSENQNHKINN